MSSPYDIDNQDPNQRPGADASGRGLQIPPPADQPILPTGRASDLLKDHPFYEGRQSRLSNINGGERAATAFDEVARAIFYLSTLALLICLGYLIYGMWGGMLADPNYSHNLSHVDRERVQGNISMVTQGMRISLLVSLASFLFLFFHEEIAGYVLLVIVLLFDFGLPFATSYFLGLNHERPSVATDLAENSIRSMAWLPAVPAIILIIFDIYRRIAGGLEEAQIRRATLKYGRNASRQVKHAKVFLGKCWNTAYCRDAIRSRCPIFVKHKGPCWRYKRGCMCEESIILQAQSGDWKQRVTNAVGQLEGHRDLSGSAVQPPRQVILTWEQKKERCRQCVIYNKHQEQKYKVLVAASFVVVFAGVWLLQANLMAMINAVCDVANKVAHNFSYGSAVTAQPDAIATPDIGGPVSWIVIGVITLVVLSKLLQLVEYCCFKIKI